MHTRIPACRSCNHKKLEPILSLGLTPLADRLLTREELNGGELAVPLNLVFCPNCSLAQIAETVPPEILFYEDYPYFSSVSSTLLKHSRITAFNLIESRELNSDSFVIELASNDGYMLKNFVKQDIPVLGIDPAKAPAEEAKKAGIPTLCTFFDRDLAKKAPIGRQAGRRGDRQ